MKKALSIFLSILMIFMCTVPAFAAEGDVTDGTEDTESTVKHKVTFVQPSEDFAGGYMFVKSVKGEVQFEEDPDGEYVFYDYRYMTMDNIYSSFHYDVPPERYSPVVYNEVEEIAYGETLVFKVMTSKKYNAYTARVYVNGELVTQNAQGDYAVFVDRDLKINITEYDKNGEEVLLRNHFNVMLTSGEGYKLKTLINENYKVVYYGDDFYFRVQIAEGYNAAGMSVTVQRGSSELSKIFGEDFDSFSNLLEENEELKSYGVDEEGCRLYKIEDIKDDCKIIIDGVQEESSVGIMAFFKRIVRLIANILSGLLGIKLDILDSITAYYNVSIDATQADGITYEVIRSSSEDRNSSEFTVTSGEGVTIIVTKQSADTDVNVMWTPGNDLGTYETPWIVDYNTVTGEITYCAVYNIDNISADTQIIIS